MKNSKDNVIGRAVIITRSDKYHNKVGVIVSVDFDGDTAFYFVNIKNDENGWVKEPLLSSEFRYLSYDHQKLIELKHRYSKRMRELQCGLFIVAEVEKHGGVLANAKLAEKLMMAGFFKSDSVLSTLEELELDPDGYIVLSNDVLDTELLTLNEVA